MSVSFSYRFNLYKSGSTKALSAEDATNILFNEDKELILKTQKTIDEFLKDSIAKLDNLSKYRIKFSKKSIAFFGDSLTSDNFSYRNIIEKASVFNQVYDFSVSCTTSVDLLRYMKQNISSNKIDYAVVFIGTNDIIEVENNLILNDIGTYSRNIDNIIRILLQMQIQVVLFTIPYQADKSRKGVIDGYNKCVKEIADKYGILFYDINNIIDAENGHESDGVHLLPSEQFKLSKNFIDFLYKTI